MIPFVLTSPEPGEDGILGMLECRFCKKRTPAYREPAEFPHHPDCAYVRDLREAGDRIITGERCG